MFSAPYFQYVDDNTGLPYRGTVKIVQIMYIKYLEMLCINEKGYYVQTANVINRDLYSA